jgi:hypothetical protein
VPAWLSLEGSTLGLTVDDSSASYPVEVELAITGLPTEEPDWDMHPYSSGEWWGHSVATAGDVDGDGYSEVVIGVPKFDGGLADEGAVYVVFGSEDGLTADRSWNAESDNEAALMGYSVSTAGDVNGDGYADIIVGAPNWTNGQVNEGAAWVFCGTGEDPPLEQCNFDQGNQAGARFGCSVATAGDVNGDAYADIMVGAIGAGADSEGKVYVWHGGHDGVSALRDWSAESNESWRYLGSSVATAGDVNGDGYADVIVGAPGCDFHLHHVPGANQGRAYVWHGSADGVNGGVNGVPSNADWEAPHESSMACVGMSVSTAGDANGDGYADVIVGGPTYYGGKMEEGAAWLYLGSGDGLEEDAVNTDEGNQAYAWFGASVATAGDVNGDGYADVIVGAPSFSDGQDNQGAAWVWHGRSSGISSLRDWYYAGDDAASWFGTSVATAGDVNGDGYSDIIVGAPGQYSGGGYVAVFHGGPSPLNEASYWAKAGGEAGAQLGFSVATAGDVNGDGFADVIVGSKEWDGGAGDEEGGVWVFKGRATGIDPSHLWHRSGGRAYAKYGYAVGTAGDVNGDGFSDIIIGAPTWTGDDGHIAEGAAWVYRGTFGGLELDDCWDAVSDQPGAQYGFSVGTAGDVNGDGYADIVVGAPYWEDLAGEEGAAFAYYGSNSGPNAAPNRYYHSNQDGAELGYAVGTAGDVNLDGYSDLIIGAPGWESSEGSIWLFLGSRTGLGLTHALRREGGQAGARYGASVGTAGDVDGDHHADVIVGAPEWDGTYDKEGHAWVLHGNWYYPYLFAGWDAPGNGFDFRYGHSVSTAGDVNGDGYADVIVGEPNWADLAYPYQGKVWVHYGSIGGLDTTDDWSHASGESRAFFGSAVGTAGDVNGDGYADIVVGAWGWEDTEKAEGKVFVYYGNGGKSKGLKPQQYIAGGWRPIGRLGHSDATDSFNQCMIKRTPFGRGEVRIELEAKPILGLFNGQGTQLGSWTDTFLGEYGACLRATGLRANTPYHWRARLRYNPGTTPFMPHSRWVTMPWNGWGEQDLRTPPIVTYVPVMLRDA